MYKILIGQEVTLSIEHRVITAIMCDSIYCSSSKAVAVPHRGVCRDWSVMIICDTLAQRLPEAQTVITNPTQFSMHHHHEKVHGTA